MMFILYYNYSRRGLCSVCGAMTMVTSFQPSRISQTEAGRKAESCLINKLTGTRPLIPSFLFQSLIEEKGDDDLRLRRTETCLAFDWSFYYHPSKHQSIHDFEGKERKRSVCRCLPRCLRRCLSLVVASLPDVDLVRRDAPPEISNRCWLHKRHSSFVAGFWTWKSCWWCQAVPHTHTHAIVSRFCYFSLQCYAFSGGGWWYCGIVQNVSVCLYKLYLYTDDVVVLLLCKFLPLDHSFIFILYCCFYENIHRSSSSSSSSS